MAGETEFERMVALVRATATPDQLRLLDESALHAPFWSARASDWISQLADLARAFSFRPTGAPWHAVEMFWIRLAGAIFELPTEWHLLRSLAEDPSSHPNTGPLRRYFEALDAVPGALSDDQLVVVDYMRSFSAHMRPHAYSLKWNRDTQTVKPSGRKVEVGNRTISRTPDDLNQLLSGPATSHGDAGALTEEIAILLLPHVSALEEARRVFGSDAALGEALRVPRE